MGLNSNEAVSNSLETNAVEGNVPPTVDSSAKGLLQDLGSVGLSQAVANSFTPEASQPQVSLALREGDLPLIALMASRTQADIISFMMENWSKQIAEQAALNKEQAIKEDTLNWVILQQQLKSRRVNDDAVRGEVAEAQYQWNSPTADFIGAWSLAPADEKKQYLLDGTDRITQMMDAQKLTPMLTMLAVVQNTVIQPMSNELVRKTDPGGDSSASLSNQLSNQADPFQMPAMADNALLINLMVPLALWSASAYASLGFLGKLEKEEGRSAKEIIDKDFVKEFGKEALSMSSSMQQWLANKDPWFNQLPPQIQNEVAIAVQLPLLGAVLYFDYCSQVGRSNAAPTDEEIRDMLKNGIAGSGNEVLNGVLGRINSILTEVADPGKRALFVQYLLNFISSAPTISLATLKNFPRILFGMHDTGSGGLLASVAR